MVNQRKAVLHALGAVGLWSTVATAFKIALTHVSPLQLLAFSSFVSLLVLFESFPRLLGQEALVLNYTWSIVLVLLSVLILGKRINFKIVAALALSFFGVIVIAARGSFSSLGFSDPVGIGLAVGS